MGFVVLGLAVANEYDGGCHDIPRQKVPNIFKVAFKREESCSVMSLTLTFLPKGNVTIQPIKGFAAPLVIYSKYEVHRLRSFELGSCICETEMEVRRFI